MKPTFRLSIVAALLGGCAISQEAIGRRLSADAPPEPGALRRPLDGLPQTLGPWVGEDRPIDDPRWRYADQHLQRIYRHRSTGQAVWLWAAFSSTGADRRHHPQVCMAVAGRAEDGTLDSRLPAFDAQADLAQFRFGTAGDAQRVFYWHYTLPSPDESSFGAAARLYWRMRLRPASLTVELAVPEGSPAQIDDAAAFARLVALAIESDLAPAGAKRGASRLPVAIVAPEA